MWVVRGFGVLISPKPHNMDTTTGWLPTELWQENISEQGLQNDGPALVRLSLVCREHRTMYIHRCRTWETERVTPQQYFALLPVSLKKLTLGTVDNWARPEHALLPATLTDLTIAAVPYRHVTEFLSLLPRGLKRLVIGRDTDLMLPELLPRGLHTLDIHQGSLGKAGELPNGLVNLTAGRAWFWHQLPRALKYLELKMTYLVGAQLADLPPDLEYLNVIGHTGMARPDIGALPRGLRYLSLYCLYDDHLPIWRYLFTQARVPDLTLAAGIRIGPDRWQPLSETARQQCTINIDLRAEH